MSFPSSQDILSYQMRRENKSAKLEEDLINLIKSRIPRFEPIRWRIWECCRIDSWISLKFQTRNVKLKKKKSTHAWKRKRSRQRRLRKDWRQARRKKSCQGYHSWHHQASDQKTRQTWRSQAYLKRYLRRNSRCSPQLPRERYQRLCDLHRARQAQDRHSSRCCLRFEETGTHPLRIRRLINQHTKGAARSLLSIGILVP